MSDDKVRVGLLADLRIYSLKRIPTSIAKGRILVHSNTRHGRNNRPVMAWTQRKVTLVSTRLVLCDCGWSGLTHYRMVDRA